MKTKDYPIEQCLPKLDLFSATQYGAMSDILRSVSSVITASYRGMLSLLTVDVAAANTPALWRQLALLVSSVPHLSSAHTTHSTN